MLRNLDRRGVISPRIDLYLGHCHLEAEEYRAAVRRYRRCVSLAPDSPAPWIGLGLCYGRLGHLERAIDAFHEALRRGPEIEEVHCNLTHCYALAGDLERARQHARRAATLDPQCPHVHRHLARRLRGETPQAAVFARVAASNRVEIASAVFRSSSIARQNAADGVAASGSAGTSSSRCRAP